MSATAAEEQSEGIRSSRSIRAYIAMAHSRPVPDIEHIERLRGEHLAALLREKIVAWSEETAEKGGHLTEAQVEELVTLLRSLTA
jgi:hypothetical protein